MVDRGDLGPRRDDRTDLRDDGGIGRFTDQQALGLARQQRGDNAEDQPDHDRGEAVDARIVPRMARPHADARDEQPGECR